MWKSDTSSKERNENDKNKFYDKQQQQQQQKVYEGSIRKYTKVLCNFSGLGNGKVIFGYSWNF